MKLCTLGGDALHNSPLVYASFYAGYCECWQIPLFFFMHGGVSYIVLCSVLGSVLIVAGLYLVLWGKVKEEPDVHPDEEVGKESVPAADTGEKETK